QADAAGSIPWHFFSAKEGIYLTVQKNPNLWVDYRAQDSKMPGLTQPMEPFTKTCNCFALDSAHEPDPSFIPYLMTGRRYYLDQLMAQASWNVVSREPHVRNFGEGIVVGRNYQVRAKAWMLRSVMNAAWIAPDSDPLKSYFVTLEG